MPTSIPSQMQPFGQPSHLTTTSSLSVQEEYEEIDAIEMEDIPNVQWGARDTIEE